MTTRATIRNIALLYVGNRDDLQNILSGGASGYDLVDDQFSRAYNEICTTGFWHGPVGGRAGYYKVVDIPELETKYSAVNLVYNTGTLSTTNGSATLVGSGTLWLTNMTPGDLIVIQSTNYFVKQVTDDTHAVLTTTYGSTNAGLAYTLYTGRYNFNSNVYSIKGVWDLTDNQPIVGDDFSNYMRRQRTTGVPSVFVRWNNSILLDPSPNASIFIDVYTRNIPPAITDDVTALLTPSYLDDGIAISTARRCAGLIGDLDLSVYLQSELDKFLDRLFPRDLDFAMQSSADTMMVIL